jgi:hypothetical protein
MMRRTLAAVAALVLAHPVAACSLCGGFLQQTPTLREEAAGPTARLILYGTLHDPQVSATRLKILRVLRDDPFRAGATEITIPRFLPVSDPKNPPHYLVFCDVFENKLDVFRGIQIRSADGLDYVAKVMKLDPKDPAGRLAFYATYLEHPDREIAADAYLEFAKATDAEIGRVAHSLSASKLRVWLKDPQTPEERLSLYAFLLGACGSDEDARFLEGLLKERGERANKTYDGALSGYIALRPREGWETAKALLADGKAPLPLRIAVTRAMRLHFGWRPKEARPLVLDGMKIMLAQGDLADMAIEDMRLWRMWELSRDVLGLFGRKGYDAPVMQEAIIRYALTCQDDASKAFLAERRRVDPNQVKQVEESLRFEK